MQKVKVDMNIGNNLRTLRKANNMEQDELVARLSKYEILITRSTYSRYETGELNVPVSIIVALHKLYGCSYDAFFEGLDLKDQ